MEERAWPPLTHGEGNTEGHKEASVHGFPLVRAFNDPVRCEEPVGLL